MTIIAPEIAHFSVEEYHHMIEYLDYTNMNIYSLRSPRSQKPDIQS